MEFINRYVDRPLLDGASSALRAWHVRTGQSPERLGPSWNLAVLFVLLALSVRFLSGTGLVLGAATLVMLSLPSAFKLMSNRASQFYNARAYRALATLALRKRETEWALRLMILLISACLPILSRSNDPAGSSFLLGASLWFVLTAPANTLSAGRRASTAERWGAKLQIRAFVAIRLVKARTEARARPF